MKIGVSNSNNNIIEELDKALAMIDDVQKFLGGFQMGKEVIGKIPQRLVYKATQSNNVREMNQLFAEGFEPHTTMDGVAILKKQEYATLVKK